MPVGEVGILADPKRDLGPTESHLRTDIRSFASVAHSSHTFHNVLPDLSFLNFDPLGQMRR